MGQSACGTDKGKLRTVNEDSMLCMEERAFYMVADGVGGHNSGEIASRLAVDLMKSCVLSTATDEMEDSLLPGYFKSCLQTVNEEIYRSATSVDENSGMATTAVALLLRQGVAYIVNVGDSRAYLYRQGGLQRITEDHTYVNQLLKEGLISREEAEVHPNRNMITRALGSEANVEPDFYRLEVTTGDRVLLCTDGLYNEICEEDMSTLIGSEPDASRLVFALIEKACANGGKDNITVCCVEI